MKPNTHITPFQFFWSPEGRMIDVIRATSRSAALRTFRARYRRSYARHMGEVYVLADARTA